MKTVGLSEEIAAMIKAMEQAQEIASKALYKGAEVMADAFTAAANSIPTEKYRFVRMYGPPADPPRNATPAEKEAVLKGIGIARFRHDFDGVDTVVGIGNAGYATNIRTKQYPNGKPIPLIANSINSGTFVIKKYPFQRMAIAAAGEKAKQAMDAEGQRLLDEVTNNG